MLVKVIGNGLTWTKRPNTNFIINDEIIFDTPQSSTKFMNGIIDYEKIKIIVISHFHSDHFTDFHVIFDYLKKRKNKEKVTVVAPRSFLKRFKKILNLLELKKNIQYIKQVFDIIEVKGGEKIEKFGYTIKPFKVEHQVSISLGYVIESISENKIVGFSGDCTVCDGLIRIIENSQTIFVECSSLKISSNHLAAKEIIDFQKKYNDKKFYAVHTNDIVYEKYKDSSEISIPSCNDEIIV